MTLRLVPSGGWRNRAEQARTPEVVVGCGVAEVVRRLTNRRGEDGSRRMSGERNVNADMCEPAGALVFRTMALVWVSGGTIGMTGMTTSIRVWKGMTRHYWFRHGVRRLGK